MKLWTCFDNYSIRIFDKHKQYDKTLKKKVLYTLVPVDKKTTKKYLALTESYRALTSL